MTAPPEPDRRNIAAFVLTMFKHVTAGTYVSLRAFPDQGGNSKPFRITTVKLNGGLDDLIDRAYRDAVLAAQAPNKVVFCPPVATFTEPKLAREQHLAEGPVLSIECDTHPRAALAKLIALLGQPTAVVESGGVWTDPETGETEPKLHIYYRLKIPARSQDELKKLKQARRLATTFVGGDVSNVTIVHPIRWPGSLHRKGDPKPCRIIKLNPDAEIELDSALQILQQAAGDAGLNQPQKQKVHFDTLKTADAFKALDPGQGLGQNVELPEYPPLPFEPIKEECAWLREAFETGGENYDQPQWNLKILCATFMENGYELAHAFGNKHPKYSIETTDEIWERKNRERKTLNLGWPSCRAIRDAQPPGQRSVCDQCPHFKEGKSPLNLGLQQDLPPAEPVPPTEPANKLPWMVELGSKLWGTATLYGKEYRFGEDQSKVIDPIKGMWFDFAANKGGYLKDLIKKVAAAATREQPNADDVVVICAADVTMKPLGWLWEGHLLRGSQELLSGLPDLSKSTVQINYIACATARLPWPDGAPAIEPMNVVMLTAEDTLEQIVVPRLRAARADVSRVHFLKCIKTDEHDRQFLLAEDLDRLESLVKKIGNVGLITIDPITAYMGGRMDSHKATEVRAQLGPLKDFAERTNIAISTITHPPKAATLRALDHFIGSQAFIAACRVGHLCIAETEENETGERLPTGRILFTNVRNTAYRQRMSTLAYRKVEVTVGTAEQGFERPVTAPQIVWEGPVDITADAAVAAASGKKSDQQPKVQAFLREMLKDGRAVPQKEIEEAATKKGFTDKQLRTAKEKLGVHVDKEPGKMTGGWFWQLPDPSDGKYYY
jgi:putative DNA primase/helicase